MSMDLLQHKFTRRKAKTRYKTFYFFTEIGDSLNIIAAISDTFHLLRRSCKTKTPGPYRQFLSIAKGYYDVKL